MLTIWTALTCKQINQFISLGLPFSSCLCVKMNKIWSPAAGKHGQVSQWWCQKTVIEVKAQQSQILCSERQRRGEGAFECESTWRERVREGKMRKWAREINTCLYDHWAAGVGHVDASRKLRSVCDHTDVRDTVTTPRCATCTLCQKVSSGDECESCFRLTNIPIDAYVHTHT